MASTAVLQEHQEHKESESEIRLVAQETDGTGVGWGILWTVGTAAAWMAFYWVFSTVMGRLLGR